MLFVYQCITNRQNSYVMNLLYEHGPEHAFNIHFVLENVRLGYFICPYGEPNTCHDELIEIIKKKYPELLVKKIHLASGKRFVGHYIYSRQTLSKYEHLLQKDEFVCEEIGLLLGYPQPGIPDNLMHVPHYGYSIEIETVDGDEQKLGCQIFGFMTTSKINMDVYLAPFVENIDKLKDFKINIKEIFHNTVDYYITAIANNNLLTQTEYLDVLNIIWNTGFAKVYDWLVESFGRYYLNRSNYAKKLFINMLNIYKKVQFVEEKIDKSICNKFKKHLKSNI